MSDKLLMWKDSKQIFYGDLNDITVTDDESTALTLKCTNQTITVSWKEKQGKEDFLSLLTTAKKEKKVKENRIDRAVFIIPRDAVTEKMPLLGEAPNPDQDQKSCCCTIL